MNKFTVQKFCLDFYKYHARPIIIGPGEFKLECHCLKTNSEFIFYFGLDKNINMVELRNKDQIYSFTKPYISKNTFNIFNNEYILEFDNNEFNKIHMYQIITPDNIVYLSNFDIENIKKDEFAESILTSSFERMNIH